MSFWKCYTILFFIFIFTRCWSGFYFCKYFNKFYTVHTYIWKVNVSVWQSCTLPQTCVRHICSCPCLQAGVFSLFTALQWTIIPHALPHCKHIMFPTVIWQKIPTGLMTPNALYNTLSEFTTGWMTLHWYDHVFHHSSATVEDLDWDWTGACAHKDPV